MDSLIETFHIDWKLMLAQGVNFTVVIIVLWRFALRPLKKLMDERAKTVEQGFLDAEASKRMLADTKGEYDAIVLNARKEAQLIIESAKKSAADEAAKMVAQAGDLSAATIAQGKAELAVERQKMIAEAKSELADMIVTATERVLEDMPMKGIDRALVDKALAKK